MKRWLSLVAALVLSASMHAPPARAADALPSDSIYHLGATFTDQDGRAFKLADARGKPRVVAMFYTGCRYVCPRIIDSVTGVEHAIPATERDRFDILLVSLDPARDDVAALRRVYDRRKLAAPWVFARTESKDVQALAALLGVRYRELADGEFNHTSSLFLLDGEGRLLADTSTLGTVPDPAFVAAVKAAIAPSP